MTQLPVIIETFIVGLILGSTLAWFHGAPAACRMRFRPVARISSLAKENTVMWSQHNNLLSLDECLQFLESSSAVGASHGDGRNKTTSTRVWFIDGSWYHKGRRNGREQFIQGPRIVDSIYFDLDDICDQSSHLSHMLPSRALLRAWMSHHGISSKDHVIVYGRHGCYFTPRVWFTLQREVDRVSLMQASLEEWIDRGGPVESTPVSVVRAIDLEVQNDRDEKQDYENIVDLSGMKQLVIGSSAGNAFILDARGSSYAQKGHMPGAIHIPYATLTEPNNTLRLKSLDELQSIFRQAGVAPHQNSTKTIVCTCGTGVSACSLYLALLELGYSSDDMLIYDGSWEEWESAQNSPRTK